jgi:PEP-CTERM motif
LASLRYASVAALDGAVVPSIGLIVPLHEPEQGGVLFSGIRQREVVSRRVALENCNRSHVEAFGVGVPRLPDANDRELIESGDAVDMIAPPDLFLNCKPPQVKLLGLSVPEPSTLLLSSIATVVGLEVWARRRTKVARPLLRLFIPHIGRTSEIPLKLIPQRAVKCH